MPTIKHLDNFTINQIAAGEVVERPSSVVKELIENSIDAKATAITLEIEKGGSSFIRITDNGIGMDKEDALISFERHATSKITEASDLDRINSLGFRGEALASIASVSQMEMITRQRDSLSGVHINNHGGRIISSKEAGCPEGTTIIVRNLFFNTPARLKFLKSDRSETAYVSELTAKIIMAHPWISIKYISNGKVIYHSPGDGSLLHAILSIYGKDIKDELLQIESKSEDKGIGLFGFIGKPSLSRTSRSHQSFYVNGRYIKSAMLSRCVEEAAKDQIMINHFPWCVLNIDIAPQDVDVNVHPSKTEVRFRNGDEVFDLLSQWIRDCIYQSLQKPAVSMPYIPMVHKKDIAEIKSAEQLSTFSGTPQQLSKNSDERNNYVKDDYVNNNLAYTTFIGEAAASKAVYINLTDKEDRQSLQNSINTPYVDNNIDTYDLARMKVIGSAFSTFILVEADMDLYIIDQHAAHERLIYERLKESISKQTVSSQQLMLPLVLEVTHDEYLTITNSIEVFFSIGFEIEPFGGKSFIVRGVPSLLKDADIKGLFNELLDQLDYRPNNPRMVLQDEDIIKMSCKKAVKANDRLEEMELKALLKDIFLEKIPLTCPHGRPILISMSRYELEKKFKRIQ